MCRHSSARQAMIQRIRDGELGQIQLIRTYRMDSGHGHGPYDHHENDLHWQIRRPDQAMWTSGGVFVNWTIHLIDECCWIKDSWPVAAHGIGGRVANSGDCSQNFESYSVEYTFADGTKALATGRYIPNCFNDFITFVHGTKCARSSPATSTHRRCTPTRTSGLPPATLPGNRPMKRSVLTWPSGVRARCDSQRPAAQRGAACGLVEPCRHHGASGRAHREGRYLGQDDGLDVSVLPAGRRPDRRQPGADPCRRPRSLSAAHPRRVVGVLSRGVGF